MWLGFFILLLLDTLTFDQHILFFSESFNGFSLAWYSTLNNGFGRGALSCGAGIHLGVISLIQTNTL